MITRAQVTSLTWLRSVGCIRSFSSYGGSAAFRVDEEDDRNKSKTVIPHVSSFTFNNSKILPPLIHLSTISRHRFSHRNRPFPFLTSHMNHRTFSHIAIPDDDEVSRKARLKSAAKKGSIAVRKGATSLRDILKKYGWTFAGTYFSIWVITLSIVFGSIDSGYVDPASLTDQVHSIWSSIGDVVGMHPKASVDPNTAVDILSSNNSDMTVDNGSEEQSSARNTVEMLASKLESWERTAPYAQMVRENPHVGNFAIAVVITKFTEVVRIPLALAIVPRISKALGQKVEEDDEEDDEEDKNNNKSEKKKD